MVTYIFNKARISITEFSFCLGPWHSVWHYDKVKTKKKTASIPGLPRLFLISSKAGS